MLKLMRWRLLLLAVIAISASTVNANAAYPDRPVRILVGSGAGGFNDFTARIVAKKLGEKWNQPVVVENKPGAGGVLSAQAVALAAPDGYTLLVAQESFTYPPRDSTLPYDPIKSFVPVIKMVSGPMVAAVKADGLPVKSFAEFVAYARANPQKVRIGHGGAGVAPDLAAQLLVKDAGLNLTLVAFNGMAPAIVALLGGHIDVAFSSENTILPNVSAGKLVPLAVAADTRLKSRPELPTVAEVLKLPSFSASSWNGIMAPAGTPADITAIIRKGIDECLNDPEVKDAFARQGMETIGGTSESYAQFLEADIGRWQELQKNKM